MHVQLTEYLHHLESSPCIFLAVESGSRATLREGWPHVSTQNQRPVFFAP